MPRLYVLCIGSILLFSGCSMSENPDKENFDQQYETVIDTSGEEEFLKNAQGDSIEEGSAAAVPNPLNAFTITGENNGYQCTVVCAGPQ